MSETVCICHLYKLAQTCSKTEFIHNALNLLLKIIQFDRAGWGEKPNLLESRHILRTFTCKIPQQIVEYHKKVDHLDPFASVIKPLLLQTQMFNMKNDSVAATGKFMVFFDKHDIPNLLHTIMLIENSLFLCSLSLFRNHDNIPFDEKDYHAIEEIIPHLFESYRLCRILDIQRKLLKSWELNGGFASFNDDGILFDMDEEFLKILENDWPDWQGARLPKDLFDSLLANQLYKTYSAYYRCTLLDGLYLLVASQLNHLEQLTNREFEIAYKFSKGKSYKEIASSLQISPSTVRNHLASSYEKLDINNKTKLIELFH